MMSWRDEYKPLLLISAVFLLCYFLPVGWPRFDNAVLEAFHLVKWYAREHVLLCLVPAFLMAGAVGVFISQSAVMRYLGAEARRGMAYGMASIAGLLLAVCSCTILPLFASIYKKGAGLGPAMAFLYAGPAINVLAIVLTARILGPQLGLARAVGAVVFSVVIGLLMHWLFRREEAERRQNGLLLPDDPARRPLWQTTLYFLAMTAILVFANWGEPQSPQGLWWQLFQLKWPLTALAAAGLGVMLVLWWQVRWWQMALVAVPVIVLAAFFPHWPQLAFSAGALGLILLASRQPGELSDWMASSWDFAKLILPLLLAGVLIAGALLGRVGEEGLIPSAWVAAAVGGNSLWANFFAAFAGAFMYFATLTEVPILQGLIGSGMGPGPALALLLAGPALSLPNMLVIRSVLGTRKTAVFVALVVVMATLSGVVYGHFFA